MSEPLFQPIPPHSGTSSFDQVQNQLGQAICDVRLAEGAIITLDEIQRQTGASRSVIREASRTLAMMGLITARQRVGLRVLPKADWNAFDPKVIAWRLSSRHASETLRALLDTRRAIEPQAARLAAQRAGRDEKAALVRIAVTLETSRDNAQDFLTHDRRFHTAVLQASGNFMFVRLAHVIDEALQGVAETRGHEATPDPDEVAMHVEVARAIQVGDAERASATLAHIIERSANKGWTL